jgi:HTH-type transcriptional regulator/antitoxin HipB
VNDLQFGSVVRMVRRRRGLSQMELAALSGVSHGTVSLMERGHCETLSLRVVRRVASALEIRLDLQARWRGGEPDRLLSHRHSRLGESFAAFLLTQCGWVVEPEVSFAAYGERGVVDLVAWHEATRHLLIIELKTEFVDINELLGTLNRKRRLAHAIAAERGWRPGLVSAWLVVEDMRTNRRHASEHRTLLRAVLPLDGRQLRPFLARPVAATFGLAFWSSASARSSRLDLTTPGGGGRPRLGHGPGSARRHTGQEPARRGSIDPDKR